MTKQSDYRVFSESEGVREEDLVYENKARRLLAPLRRINALFVVTVIIPTILATIYFGFLANDVYISESRFVVRNPAKTSVSPLGAVLSGAGLGGGIAGEESAAVSEYLQSRRALEDVNRDGLVEQAYGDPDIFVFDRFGGLGGESDEQLYRYFLDKVAASQGTTTQVTTLIVRAFDPRDAQLINARLLRQSEELVNSLSERARNDSLELAREQVDEAAAQARNAALEMANFRDRQGIVDPEQQSDVGLQMISKLQDELIAARTQLRQLQTYTPQAPQIPFLQTQIRETEREIAQAQDALAGGNASLSTAMVRYQELLLASQFAERQMTVALASLQEAQAEARRKRAYVERIANPSLPDFAEEPRRLRGILATLVLGLLTWGVLSMLLVGVREHRD